MRAAIAAADVGDEQRREDPTVNLLQERAAVLLGQEAAGEHGSMMRTLDLYR